MFYNIEYFVFHNNCWKGFYKGNESGYKKCVEIVYGSKFSDYSCEEI